MTLEHILKRVCEARKVSTEDVQSRSRKQYIKDTRHIFIEVAYRYGYMNSKKHSEVMAFLGRNRTTQYNSRNVARWQLRSEVERCYEYTTTASLVSHLEKRREQRKKVTEVFAE